MLQQTQVPRVILKYHEFLKRFPSVQALASSPLSSVLQCWSGLGYNRRGKYLHDAAKIIVSEFGGNFKQALQHPLPGVGPYTKAAVRVFAFNEPDVPIETNIRAAFIRHFFNSDTLNSDTGCLNSKVVDVDVLQIAQNAARGQDPREWHWALMDYGAYLKRSGVRNNHRSAHYTKQSKFEGSLRQVRGAIIKALSKHEENIDLRNRYEGWYKEALARLERDGLIVKEKGKWRIA